MESHHQFKKEQFYSPKWRVEFLFIGTFNPSGGKPVPYYYGRKTNRFWKLLSEVFEIELDPYHELFFEGIKKLKVGCMDLIDSVSYDEQYNDKVLGKGYKDSELFKSDITKSYNTQNILTIISKNKLEKVYFTNSGGSLRKEQNLELQKIEQVCEIVYLCSPSPINPNREKCLDDYKSKIKP